jgi:hypothetical protein
MSSTYLTSHDMTVIASLLTEEGTRNPGRSTILETAQARLLVHAIEGGMDDEAELRNLLAEQVRFHGIIVSSRQRWVDDTSAPLHRQEHQLPSPEEEFNAATTISSVENLTGSNRIVAARNEAGETALVHMLSHGVARGSEIRWARLDTGEPFAAVNWSETTWSVAELGIHVSGAHK